MNTVFNYTKYQDYLKEVVQDRKQRGRTKAELAKILGCQAAYLSQVLVGRVDLTEDHLIRLAEYLSLNELETEYLLVLLRLDKAGTPELRAYLVRQRERLSDSNREFEDRLSSKKIKTVDDGGAYYASSYLPSLIHLATSCRDFKTKTTIAERFGLPVDVVDEHLHQLEKYKWVEFQNGKWNYAGSSLHFPRHSPLDKQMQFARRLLAMKQMAQRREEDLHYSVLFSADDKTLALLREYFLKAIEYVHKTVEPVDGRDVYAICLDAFRA